MKHERLHRIVHSPHMSEKAVIAAEKRNEYVFEVASDATKSEIKEAVQVLFKTSVEQVRIVNVKTKPKRFGKVEGRSKAWKKAYVTLSEGQRIEFGGAQ